MASLAVQLNNVTVKSRKLAVQLNNVTVKSGKLAVQLNNVTVKSRKLAVQLNNVTMKSRKLAVQLNNVTMKSRKLVVTPASCNLRFCFIGCFDTSRCCHISSRELTRKTDVIVRRLVTGAADARLVGMTDGVGNASCAVSIPDTEVDSQHPLSTTGETLQHVGIDIKIVINIIMS